MPRYSRHRRGKRYCPILRGKPDLETTIDSDQMTRDGVGMLVYSRRIGRTVAIVAQSPIVLWWVVQKGKTSTVGCPGKTIGQVLRRAVRHCHTPDFGRIPAVIAVSIFCTWVIDPGGVAARITHLIVYGGGVKRIPHVWLILQPWLSRIRLTPVVSR